MANETKKVMAGVLALSLVCFGVDYLLYHRKGDAADEQ